MTDPIPAPLSGDTGTIQRFAQTYRETASALRDAVSSLAALANENVTISLAVDEVREKAIEARDATGSVATRYEGAADTYSAYRTALVNAQSKADQARTAIDANNSSARYWRNRRRQLIAQSVLSPSEELLEDLREANDRVDGFATEFASAMAVYNQAVQDKADAVAVAIAGLDTAADAAGLNDGFFDAISGALQQLYELAQTHLAPIIEQLREILEFIKSIVDVISFIVTILAIFFPVLFGPIAMALTVLSIALSAAIFLSSLALFALGKESLGRVLSDGIGVAISIVTSKFGAGGAHAAGTAAHVPFSQVAAANGGVLRTVFAATAEVSEHAAGEAIEGLGQSAMDFALKNTLNITFDQFPNANGPVGSESGVLEGGGVRWDFSALGDPATYGEWALGEAIGIAAPGADKVLDAVSEGFDVFGGEWSAPSFLWDVAAS